MERRAMIDKDELRSLLKEVVSDAGHCTFSEEERTAIHNIAKIDPNMLAKLVKMYEETTSNFFKGLLKLATIGVLFLAGIGAYSRFTGKG